MNECTGNGSAFPGGPPLPAGVSNDFGIGLVGTSKDNLIEENKIGGNLNGVYIGSATQGGNIIRGNIITGNPPVQVSETFGASVGADIQEVSLLGGNTFEENLCLTYAGPTVPAPCPNLSRPDDNEDQQGGNVVASRAVTTPAQRADAIMDLLMMRSEPALANAAFHVRRPRFPNAVGLAEPAQATDSTSVTVTGKVVDAACYMLHASAATSASHRDCGAACLARGVPLAIAADDGALYFPADGNQRLKTLLNARVRASGTLVEKHEPMELKMPVGDKNQMVVRVEGGYKQITIETLEKIPAEKR